MTQHERINFGISQFLAQWIQTQPDVVGVQSSPNYAVVDHNMTAAELTAFKQNVINRLSETLPPT